jgi:hypothetical protein
MSTSTPVPVSPAAGSPVVNSAATTIFPSWVTTWEKFVKTHEKLAIVVIAALLLLYLGNKGLNVWDAYEKSHATAAQQVVVTDAATNQALANQLALLKVQVDAANATAKAAIAASHAKTQAQQKVDAVLPLPALALRWESLLALKTEDITVGSNNNLIVDADGAHSTVNALEKIPDLTTSLAQTNTELAGCTVVRAQQDATITGLNKQLADTQTARTIDAKAAAAAQKKAWLKGFKWGAVVGFIGGVFVGHGI